MWPYLQAFQQLLGLSPNSLLQWKVLDNPGDYKLHMAENNQTDFKANYGCKCKSTRTAFLRQNKLNQIQHLLNIFLINMTTWEDSPDMLLIAATIKWTNTVSASSEGPNSLKI